MVGSMMLLVLVPGAPVPTSPPPPAAVEVTAKHYPHPPLQGIGAMGQPELFPVDDGLFVQVTVKNVSDKAISVPYTKKLSDRVSVQVTDPRGVVVSDPKRHLGFRRVNEVQQALELKPGESFTVISHLEQNWDDDGRAPGKHVARIVFECGPIRAESKATFTLEVTK